MGPASAVCGELGLSSLERGNRMRNDKNDEAKVRCQNEGSSFR